MKPSRLSLSLLAAAAAVVLLAAAGCGGSGGGANVPAGAVAVVDGAQISKAELDALLGRAKKSYTMQKRQFPKAGTPEYQSLQTQAVAYLVQRKEYEQEAGKLGLTVSDKEIAARIAQIKKTYFKGDQKKLDKQLADQGYSPEGFRADIRSQLLSEKLYKQVTKAATVSAAEVRQYYDQNRSQYVVPESRVVRHILVKTKAQADRVYADLQKGGDFAALAKQLSIDPGSKSIGGKLTISKGQTVPEFDRVAFQLKTGETSKPVKTQFGYHVIQAVGPIKPGSVTSFARVKAQIEKLLLDKKKAAEVQTWAAGVKKRYGTRVTYASGFAPPPAATQSQATTTQATSQPTTSQPTTTG